MKLKISGVMSQCPVVVRCQDGLTAAYKIMQEARVRHLPVVDEEDTLVGIISDRDFQRAMWPMQSADVCALPEGPNATVYDYMSWPVKSLQHTSDLVSAIQLMINEKISAVVVTDQENMIGIITHEDLLRVLVTLLKESESLREKTLRLAYNSPLGQVTETLAAMGI